MSFIWGHFWDISRDLLNQTERNPELREGVCRIVVSRAYYAAFCTARNYAKIKFSYVPDQYGSDHAKVRRCYKNTRLSFVSDELERLILWREKCDYADSLDDMNLEEVARNALTRAKKVLDTCK